jgi:hypothetical protein
MEFDCGFPVILSLRTIPKSCFIMSQVHCTTAMNSLPRSITSTTVVGRAPSRIFGAIDAEQYKTYIL